MKPDPRQRSARPGRRRPAALTALLAGSVAFLSSSATVAPQESATLEEVRLKMDKWIETQQIISKERNEWQQGKEVLRGRLELVGKELADLDAKRVQSEAELAELATKRAGLVTESERLEALNAQLAGTVTRMETEVRRLFKSLPDPIQARLQPLYQRIPENAQDTKVSVPERFQNVLGILNDVNKANNEIAVNYEVRTLSDGKPSEVRVLYVGLAQAYYFSSGGEAGIGRPGPEGWQWNPSRAIAGDVLTALDIMHGKHTPAFVPLPVVIQ